MTKKKLLWVGDAGCESGFARATHGILATLHEHYDVTVLALNYQGDPVDMVHGDKFRLPYPLYCAYVGGDSIGVGRIAEIGTKVKPDVIVIQQDGWFIPYYIAAIRNTLLNGEYAYPELAAAPIVAAVAVDGKNFRGDWLKDVSLAVFWTQFGLNEARIGGYAGNACVIPLGVDLNTFYPVDRHEALARQGALILEDFFIVGTVNRNQYRKRWDLTIKYFAEWVNSRHIKDAELFIHSAPTGDESINVLQLAKYYGVSEHLAFREPAPFHGKPDDDMRDTYSFFDCCVSMSMGEGFGLTTAEAMACGVPCIVPAWSALGDWAAGGTMQIPCTTMAPNAIQSTNGSAVIGGVADQRQFVEALDMLYRDKEHRRTVAERGRTLVSEPQFRWENIGQAWVKALDDILRGPEHVDDGDAVWQELRPVELTK